MRIFYVIKNFTSENFISVDDKWDDWNMGREVQTKQDAVNHGIENGLGLCIIQEVIDF